MLVVLGIENWGWAFKALFVVGIAIELAVPLAEAAA